MMMFVRARLESQRAFAVPGVAVALYAISAVTFAAVALLAITHIDDLYDVGAAGGAWMGLATAARHGVLYPPIFAHGFFGGTRYMPLPIVIEAAGTAVAGSILAPAKVLVLISSIALLVLVYAVARRRGAPTSFAVLIVAAILASSAGETTTLGVRWDALATLLQLGAVVLIADRISTRRAAGAGVLCAFAIAAKFSALWAPAAIFVWLLWRMPRKLVPFIGALVLAAAALTGIFEALSDGRFLRNVWTFAFAGSQHAPLLDGAHRLYQLAVRNERELPLFLLLGFLALAAAAVRRRIEVYELGLVFLVPILLVVMRDQGAYENHLLDLEVLAGLVLAGAWRRLGSGRRGDWLRLGVAACTVLALVVALRYTVVPDARAALAHGSQPQYTTDPFPALARSGTCALFEDASIPILAGQRPVVLDAFIVHRLQTVNPRALGHLVKRVDDGSFRGIVLNFPLTNLGWFATLDFGTKLALSMRTHYRLASVEDGAYVYRPKHPSTRANACGPAPLGSWK